MLGCDIFPSGITGVGKEAILSLFSSWNSAYNSIISESSPLNIIRLWIRTNFIEWKVCSKSKNCDSFVAKFNIYCCQYCERWAEICQYREDSLNNRTCICSFLNVNPAVVKAENTIKRRMLKINTLTVDIFNTIVKEFSNENDENNDDALKRFVNEIKSFPNEKPDLINLVQMLIKRLDWTVQYSCQQSQQFLSVWNLIDKVRLECKSWPNDDDIQLKSITKRRNLSSLPHLNITWDISNTTLSDLFNSKTFDTCELLSLVEKAYPKEVEDFTRNETNKKKKAAKISSRSKNDGGLLMNVLKQKRMSGFVKKKIDVMITEHEDEKSFCDEDSLCSNMSMLVDDLISQQVSKSTNTSSSHLSIGYDNFQMTTSTPNRNKLENSTGTQQKGEVSVVSMMDELEDTFDRMCL